MRKIIVTLLASLPLFFSLEGLANDAGCGLGSLIIPKNTKISQTVAITTNFSFFSQFFGITSGTSGCSASGIVQADEQAAVYAEANFQSLKIEMARGEGENLSAFSQLLGCKQTTEFARMAREKYETIYSSQITSPIDMVKTVRQEITKDAALSKSCSRVS